MKLHDIIGESLVQEIERISKYDYEGGKESLYDKSFGKQVKKLPGSSGLLYSTSEGRYGSTDIKLWDPNGTDYLAQQERGVQPKPVQNRREPVYQYERRVWEWQRAQRDLNAPGQLIGKLSVSDAKYFPLKGAVQVDTITVDEDYRGGGIAKALYGIVLTIMKRPLLAGSSQTPGGRKNWVSLASIPGVEMKGYVSIDEDDITPTTQRSRFSVTTPSMADKNIDVIMGQLGGQYIGRGRNETHYFAFDVKPTTSGKELEAYVKQNLARVYNENYNTVTGLYAVWTGR